MGETPLDYDSSAVQWAIQQSCSHLAFQLPSLSPPEWLVISSVGLKPASSSPSSSTTISSHLISSHLISSPYHPSRSPAILPLLESRHVAPPRRSQDCICPFGIGLDSMGAQSGAEVYVSQSVRQVVATSRNRSCESLAPSMPVEFSAAETEQGREQRGGEPSR